MTYDIDLRTSLIDGVKNSFVISLVLSDFTRFLFFCMHVCLFVYSYYVFNVVNVMLYRLYLLTEAALVNHVSVKSSPLLLVLNGSYISYFLSLYIDTQYQRRTLFLYLDN